LRYHDRSGGDETFGEMMRGVFGGEKAKAARRARDSRRRNAVEMASEKAASEATARPQGVAKQRVRTKWQVAFTLLNNPELLKVRAGHIWLKKAQARQAELEELAGGEVEVEENPMQTAVEAAGDCYALSHEME
jgi:hypothetical protein